jgi:hypothetical protein
LSIEAFSNDRIQPAAAVMLDADAVGSRKKGEAEHPTITGFEIVMKRTPMHGSGESQSV